MEDYGRPFEAVVPVTCGPYEVAPYHAAILARRDARAVYIGLLESPETKTGGQLEALDGLGYVDVSAMRSRAAQYLARTDSVVVWGGDFGFPKPVNRAVTDLLRLHPKTGGEP